MSLLRDQSSFLLHVAELIRKASELGFLVSGGELYRTPEQQALHVKNGRSKTMNSQHLKRLAVDLNFFREQANGEYKLTYEVAELQALGNYWESLDPANRWGGNWNSFKDAPHFERRDGGATPARTDSLVSTRTVDTGAAQAKTIKGAGLLQAAVGTQSPNNRDDVETVQRLLNLCAGQQQFELPEGPLKADGAFGKKTLAGIMAFQRTVMGTTTPDGRVGQASAELDTLCRSLPSAVDTQILLLLYLRAGEQDVIDLAQRITRIMANRGIDSALRQAHFLSQIGHESGELRFKAEIASGEAYEGRLDLGNIQPGDGRRYKGRGLIQLTGRANYAEYGKAIGREAEILQSPELIEQDPELCVDVAGWFWTKRNLNLLADADDLTAITKRVNGGLNGLEDRRRLLNRAKSLLIPV